jgi:hypothetical protein
MANDCRLFATIVGKKVAAHNDVVTVGIEPCVGRCAHLDLRLGEIGHFLHRHSDRVPIRVDAGRVPMRSDALGHDPKHGAGTAADVCDTRSLEDACCSPIGGLSL